MSTVSKNVIVSKEASELVQSIVQIVKSAKNHVADGFQAGQDVPAVLLENLQSLLAGVAGVEQMPVEAKEDIEAFMNAWALGGTETAGLFLK